MILQYLNMAQRHVGQAITTAKAAMALADTNCI